MAQGKSPTGMVVHHRDGNHFNDSPENRQVMTQGAHVGLHKLGNRYGEAHLGRKLSAEHRRKMSEARIGHPSTVLGKHWTLSPEARASISAGITEWWRKRKCQSS